MNVDNEKLKSVIEFLAKVVNEVDGDRHNSATVPIGVYDKLQIRITLHRFHDSAAKANECIYLKNAAKA